MPQWRSPFDLGCSPLIAKPSLAPPPFWAIERVPFPETGEEWDESAKPNDLNLALPWAILYLVTEHKEA